VLSWPIAARFRKDVQFAFVELKEKLVTSHKAHIVKAVAAVKKDDERRGKT